ncbi:MAG: CBS domain-containing protein [Candidatus Brocadiae bacterium]|nr:CBS domain-containing protein [Candidatus Brocadiia bacterium]
MIPKLLNEELKKLFSYEELEKKKIVDGCYSFVELNGEEDKALIEKLGIQVDALGPKKVIFLWEHADDLEMGGYLVVDNLSMGKPSLGGTRFTKTVSPREVASLARGMTLKNAAADLPFGGGKSGIIGIPNITPEQRAKVIENFAKMLSRYIEIYNPGPDVGTNDEDMKTFAIYNGLNNVVSKTVDMGGNRIDLVGAAAGGTVVAMDQIFSLLYKLRELPQFKKYPLLSLDQATLLIQGFGAVGANFARLLLEGNLLSKCQNPPKLTGVSDEDGYIYSQDGLDVYELLRLKTPKHVVTSCYYQAKKDNKNFKFCNVSNDLLKESADILLTATPIPNYVGIDEKFHPCVTADKAGAWMIVIEAANTLSLEKERIEERHKIEKILFQKRGVFIATDYLVNSGGVIFAAYEKLLPTPKELDIPESIRGDKAKVQEWLEKHKEQFAELAKERRKQAEQKRDQVIRENITLFIRNLVADPDLLPYQVAEKISLERIIHQDRFVKDVMITQFTCCTPDMTIPEAAKILVAEKMDFLPVVDNDKILLGVISDWDVTRFVNYNLPRDTKVKELMTPGEKSITISPTDAIIHAVKLLQNNLVSAVPVVDEKKKVVGIVTSDLLVHRTLLKLLER